MSAALDSLRSLVSDHYLVIRFLRIVLVPVGNFDNDVRRAIGHGLAAEARLRRDPRRLVQLIKLGVGGFVAGLKTLLNDHVARRAGAHSSASMVQPQLEA